LLVAWRANASGRSPASMPPPSSVLDAALGQADADFGSAGVEAVLEQFLQHRGRALHHFAGGDLADEGVGKEANRGHGGAFFVGPKYTGNRQGSVYLRRMSGKCKPALGLR
jgi:hypothetical protein